MMLFYTQWHQKPCQGIYVSCPQSNDLNRQVVELSEFHRRYPRNGDHVEQINHHLHANIHVHDKVLSFYSSERQMPKRKGSLVLSVASWVPVQKSIRAMRSGIAINN